MSTNSNSVDRGETDAGRDGGAADEAVLPKAVTIPARHPHLIVLETRGGGRRTDVGVFGEVLLAMHAVKHMANALYDTAADLDRTGDPRCGELAAENRAQLGRMAGMLRTIMEDAGDYLNGCDAVTDEDVELLAPAFRLVRSAPPAAANAVTTPDLPSVDTRGSHTSPE